MNKKQYENYRKVTINYDERSYSLEGDAELRDEKNFIELVDFLLHLTVDDIRPYNFVMGRNTTMLTLDHGEASVLEKIVLINRGINKLKGRVIRELSFRKVLVQ